MKCETCNDNKYINSNNEQGQNEVQKCDECNYFANDNQAQLYKLIYKTFL